MVGIPTNGRYTDLSGSPDLGGRAAQDGEAQQGAGGACEGTGGADEGTGGVWRRLAPGPLHSATEKFL